MTRAVSDTRSTAWTRPMNSEVSVMTCFWARTTPTAGGPEGIWALAAAAPVSAKAASSATRRNIIHGPSRAHAAVARGGAGA